MSVQVLVQNALEIHQESVTSLLSALVTCLKVQRPTIALESSHQARGLFLLVAVSKSIPTPREAFPVQLDRLVISFYCFVIFL